MKMLHTLIGAALIAGSSAVSASEPIALNNAELDGVTAGVNVQLILGGTAVAFAEGGGLFGSVNFAETFTDAVAVAEQTGLFTHNAFGSTVQSAIAVSQAQ